MSKARTIHRCSECGSAFPRWAGRCGMCGEWNSLVEEEVDPPVPAAAGAAGAGWGGAGGAGAGSGGTARLAGAGWGGAGGLAVDPVSLAAVDPSGSRPVPTGLGEMDRVLGGGLVPGSVTLLAGEPGIGKSTLLLQCLAESARHGRQVLLVTGEESPEQVRRRADRLGAVVDGLSILPTTDLAAVFASVSGAGEPAILAVDSIQTLTDPSVSSAAGTVAQVRECANALVHLAKQVGVTVLLVGHVTKEGAIAGPKALEHVVDTVLELEGERHHALRLLGATKHRFGPTGEIGVLEMRERGLAPVSDPSRLLTAERRPGVPGSAVVPVLEGQRPILVEVQALVTRSPLPSPRRSAQGLSPSRLALLLAVLERRVGMPFGTADVFASVVGGVRVAEPALDLGLGLALVSAWTGVPIPADLVACGEVGLAGEIRQVQKMSQRLSEACRLGFTRAMVGPCAPEPPNGVTVSRAATMAEAAEQLLASSTVVTGAASLSNLPHTPTLGTSSHAPSGGAARCST